VSSAYLPRILAALPLLCACGSATEGPTRPATSVPATTGPTAAVPMASVRASSAPLASSASSTPVSALSQTIPPVASTAPAMCASDERSYGSTCCSAPQGREERHPGQTIMDCHGPKIGQSCKAKGDCDLACSCDDPKVLLSPSHDHAGPKDGARGVTGVCGARVQVGVWMCQIDERGVVTHVIID